MRKCLSEPLSLCERLRFRKENHVVMLCDEGRHVQPRSDAQAQQDQGGGGKGW